MLLLLAAVSAVASTPPPVRVGEPAQVSIVILQPYRATAKSWAPSIKPNQREMVKKELAGDVRLRLTEFE